jgi:hypothetical protein
MAPLVLSGAFSGDRDLAMDFAKDRHEPTARLNYGYKPPMKMDVWPDRV